MRELASVHGWLARLTLLALLAETVAKRALAARPPAPPLGMRSRPLQSPVPSQELDMRWGPPAPRATLPLLAVDPGPPTCVHCDGIKNAAFDGKPCRSCSQSGCVPNTEGQNDMRPQ